MELRPFLQFNKFSTWRQHSFQLRARNEFRFFNGHTTDQLRLRLQTLFLQKLFSHAETKLFYFNEFFFIIGYSKPWEWRAGFQIQQPIAKGWKVGLGYIYQNNENSNIRSVHVIQITWFYEFLLK